MDTGQKLVAQKLVAQFRARALEQDAPASLETYKGLPAFALPGLHAFAASIAQGFFPPGARVLDLAAGSGALSLRLKDLGFAVVATDLVDEGFRLRDDVPFVAANCNDDFHRRFADTFDAIAALEIAEHLENPRHFLRECRQLLRPGGRIILTTPNVESPRAIERFIRTGCFAYFTDASYRGSGHITPLTLWQLRKVVDEAGFDIDRVTSFGRLRSSAYMRRLRATLIRLLAGRRPVEEGEILVMCLTRRPDSADQASAPVERL